MYLKDYIKEKSFEIINNLIIDLKNQLGEF